MKSTDKSVQKNPETRDNTGSSGEGTRPTSANIDRTGTDPFTTGKIPDGKNAIPSGKEKMLRKRTDDETDTTTAPSVRSSDGEQ